MESEIKSPQPIAMKTALAFKAARMSRSLTRPAAAKVCGCSIQALEQIENGRKRPSEGRLRVLVDRLGVEWERFLEFQTDPQKFIANASEVAPSERSLKRKPRRNEYKIITKEVRVIRSLRKRRGLSQSEASRLCGFGPQGFGFLEAGRVELTHKRVTHILKSFGHPMRMKWIRHRNAETIRRMS